jgi:predicted nucleic acid-binding protein
MTEKQAQKPLQFTRNRQKNAFPGTQTEVDRSFFDTNVLVYAEDPSDPRKREIATNLIVHHLRQRTGVLSVQVLQEYFVSATGKLKREITLVRQQVEFFTHFQVVEPTAEDVLAAIDLRRLYGFSIWDALILRAAKKAGCRVLLSEDMQHGQTIDGVRIVNPFL